MTKEYNIMKKTIRLTSAAMAAIIAVSCASIPVFAEEPVLISSGTAYAEEVSGGWEVNSGSTAMSKNPKANAAFKKATEELVGVSYKPIAVLGSQVVAGMNYAILCRANPVYPDASPEVVIMYIYESLDGNAEITGFQTIIGEQTEGGFSANTGKFAIKYSKNKSVYSAYKKAMKDLVGVDYKPVLYLGSQVVAGSNYMILCRSQVVYPGAPYEWSLVTVNKDLNGKASLVDIQALELGNIDDETAGDDNVQIPNPWQEYKTVSEAANAAGFGFNAPEKIGKYTVSYVQAMDGIVEVTYADGGSEFCVRKGTGTDDISGDYNTYKNISEKKIGGNTVTLRGNGDGVNSSVWTDGSYSYSIYSGDELTAAFIEDIISSIA